MDAVAVLREHANFKKQDHATVRLAPMRLLSREIVTMVDLVFSPSSGETGYSVSLPTCTEFTAQATGSSHSEEFEIARLDKATVDSAGTVTLEDGGNLRWVQVVPVQLPYEPSAIDWRIIYYAVSALGAEDRCYRWYGEGLPPELQVMVSPNLKFLDCSRLAGLELPPLKELAFQIRKKDPIFKKLSEQKIADALRRFGMRHPKARPRRK